MPYDRNITVKTNSADDFVNTHFTEVIMQLKDSETFKNLARAFAGECMAKARYDYIVYGAKQEGYSEMAKIIKQVANQEFHHSRMFYSFIQTADKNAAINSVEICAEYPFKEKWELENNLKLLAEDEETEAEIYAEFIKVAEDEGFPEIATLFKNIMDVEIRHKQVFLELYKQFKNGDLYKKKTETMWYCPACGYVGTGKEAWEKCPLCEAEQGVCEVVLPPDILI